MLDKQIVHTGLPPADMVPMQAISETLPIEQVSQRMELIDKVIHSFMKPGEDYGTIPGTNKPTLFKAGAEKLGLAFQLSPTFEVIDKIEDHFREWQYSKWDKETKNNIMVWATGFFFYRVGCTLTHRVSGIVIAHQEATCSSMERGREVVPANTILKMAEKRAYVGAVLLATFSSNRFTQDMEDYAHEESGKPAEAKAKPSEERTPAGVHIEREMKSRYGSVKEPTKCGFCKQLHIKEGDTIVLIKEGDADKGIWGAKACYLLVEDKLQKQEAKPTGIPLEDEDIHIQELLSRDRQALTQLLGITLAETFGDSADGEMFFDKAIEDGLLADAILTSAKNNKGHLAKTIVALWKIKAPKVRDNEELPLA